MRTNLSKVCLSPYHTMPTQKFRYYPGYPYIKHLPKIPSLQQVPTFVSVTHTAAAYPVVHYSIMSTSYYISPADHTLLYPPFEILSHRPYIQIRNYLANTTYSTPFYHKNTTRDLCLGRGRIRFFSSGRYSIFPGAVCCGAVYTCNHTRFIDRFMMTEGGDSLSLPFTSKTE